MATSTKKRSTTGKTTTSRAAPRSKTSTSTTTAASKASPKVQTKPAVTPVAPAPVVVAATPVVAEPAMRKKELIDQVVERSGIKKKDAKPVVEAMLAVLGEAVGEGRELNLQPLGKLRINRSEERSNGRVIICKLRQSAATVESSSEKEKTDVPPLAEVKG